MTPLNTIIEEIMNKWCDKYGHFLAFESDALTDLTITIQRAYEAGQSEERAKIREEVEGLLKTEYNIDFRTIEKVLAKL